MNAALAPRSWQHPGSRGIGCLHLLHNESTRVRVSTVLFHILEQWLCRLGFPFAQSEKERVEEKWCFNWPIEKMGLEEVETVGRRG